MDELHSEDRGPVRLLTLHRPQKRNALDHALSDALLGALRAADADPGVRALVLTGAGSAFCAGADRSEFGELTPEHPERLERRAELTASLHGAFARLRVPVVTAINGPALGGGAGLALAGDLALMAEDAVLGYPEVKLGIVAAIVLPNLVRQVGRKAAFELVATGAPIGAERALALGMVNRVLPGPVLLGAALELAAQLAELPAAALAATKELFYRVSELPFEQALAAGRETNQRMRGLRGAAAPGAARETGA